MVSSCAIVVESNRRSELETGSKLKPVCSEGAVTSTEEERAEIKLGSKELEAEPAGGGGGVSVIPEDRNVKDPSRKIDPAQVKQPAR